MHTKDFDQLKSQWQEKVEKISVQSNNLISSLEKETRKMHRSLFWRDVSEICTAVFIIIVFSVIFLTQKGTPNLSKLGYIVAIFACIFIIYKLISARYKNTDIIFTSLEKNIKYQITFFEKQKDLLNSVLLWYIGPVIFSLILVFAGFGLEAESLPKFLLSYNLYFFGVTVITVLIWLANKYAARKTIQPIIDRLNAQLEALHNVDS